MIAHRLLETERGSDAAIIFLGQIPIQFCSGDLFGGDVKDCCSWHFSKGRAHIPPLRQEMDAFEFSSNIRDYGSMADVKGKRVVCYYCQKNVDFSRLKCHLGHVGTDVTHCEKVSIEVMEVMRNVVFECRRK